MGSYHIGSLSKAPLHFLAHDSVLWAEIVEKKKKERKMEFLNSMASRHGCTMVRLFAGNYQRWDGSIWVDIGPKEVVVPPGDGYTHHEREPQGVMNALLAVGVNLRFILVENDGTWHLAQPAVGRYVKTVFPKGKPRRLW